MATPGAESVPHSFEFPPGVDLETYCKDQFRHMRLAYHRFRDGHTFDEATGFYDDEKIEIDSLISRCSEYMGESDIALVQKSLTLMLFAHATQYRDSWEPYSMHCVASASILANRNQEGTVISSGLLHDTTEDTGITQQLIHDDIQPEVAETVEGVSKHRSHKLRKTVTDEKARFKAVFSIVDNVRVILVKLADRLHNMRTLKSNPPYLDPRP